MRSCAYSACCGSCDCHSSFSSALGCAMFSVGRASRRACTKASAPLPAVVNTMHPHRVETCHSLPERRAQSDGALADHYFKYKVALDTQPLSASLGWSVSPPRPHHRLRADLHHITVVAWRVIEQTPSTMKPTQTECARGSVNQIPPHATIMGDCRITPFYKAGFDAAIAALALILAPLQQWPQPQHCRPRRCYWRRLQRCCRCCSGTAGSTLASCCS
jgi:hypothetical protein